MSSPHDPPGADDHLPGPAPRCCGRPMTWYTPDPECGVRDGSWGCDRCHSSLDADGCKPSPGEDEEGHPTWPEGFGPQHTGESR